MKWVRILVVAAIYFVLSEISFYTVHPSSPAGPSMAWLPTGFSVAAILTLGYSVWPGILLGSILNAYPFDLGWGGVVSFAAANTIDPLIAAYLPRKILGHEVDFSCLHDVTVFILCVIFVSSTFSAFAGTTAFLITATVPFDSLFVTWVVWWVSDFLSVLIVTPFLMIWKRPSCTVKLAEWPEIAVASLISAAMLTIIFTKAMGPDTLHFVYWLIPLVIWLCFRVGHRGAATGIFIFSAVVIATTTLGIGPFNVETVEHSFLYVESFLSVISILGLILAAAVGERDRAIRLRDDFALLASHELNTPLTVLGMQYYFLRELIAKNKFEDLPVERRKEMLRVNSREVKKLTELVDDLLQGAQVATGKLEIALVDLDFKEVIADVIKDHSEQIAGYGAEVRFEGDSIQGKWDRRKLYFVVKTLLLNALKYGEKKPVYMRLYRIGSQACLIVQDQGVGIPEEHHIKIFERFGRSGKIRHYGGLGQGLFISKAIVEAHGGKLEIKSEPGSGSTFSVELPVTT